MDHTQHVICDKCGYEYDVPLSANYIYFCPDCHTYNGFSCEYGYAAITPCKIYHGESEIGSLTGGAGHPFHLKVDSLHLDTDLKEGYKKTAVYYEAIDILKEHLAGGETETRPEAPPAPEVIPFNGTMAGAMELPDDMKNLADVSHIYKAISEDPAEATARLERRRKLNFAAIMFYGISIVLFMIGMILLVEAGMREVKVTEDGPGIPGVVAGAFAITGVFTFAIGAGIHYKYRRDR